MTTEESEPVWIRRSTQDAYELRPPVTWPDVRFLLGEIELGRVHIVWDDDGEDARVTVIAWQATGDEAPFISVVNPSLLDLFEPLIEQTRPTRPR